jgi:hypothetical protein
VVTLQPQGVFGRCQAEIDPTVSIDGFVFKIEMEVVKFTFRYQQAMLVYRRILRAKNHAIFHCPLTAVQCFPSIQIVLAYQGTIGDAPTQDGDKENYGCKLAGSHDFENWIKDGKPSFFDKREKNGTGNKPGYYCEMGIQKRRTIQSAFFHYPVFTDFLKLFLTATGGTFVLITLFAFFSVSLAAVFSTLFVTTIATNCCIGIRAAGRCKNEGYGC